MDIRRHFDTFLQKYGHNVFVQRLCTSCVPSGAYLSRDPDCPECAGTGYSRTLERHTCRRMLLQGGSKSPAEGVEYVKEGSVPAHGWAYYFRYDVEPRLGDRIYDGGEILRINEVYDPRGDRGRVEYYICRARRLEGKEYAG